MRKKCILNPSLFEGGRDVCRPVHIFQGFILLEITNLIMNRSNIECSAVSVLIIIMFDRL